MGYPKEQLREKESTPTTLEGRLARKFDDLQLAREMRNSEAFDELGRSIEVLFKAIPRIYEELMQEKEELDKEVEAVYEDIAKRAEEASDIVYRDAIIKNESYQTEWAYREAYEELIMDKLQKFDLIPIRSPKYSALESTASTSVMIDKEEEEQEEQEEKPQPEKEKPKQKAKKPKLSIKRKNKSINDNDNFEI